MSLKALMWGDMVSFVFDIDADQPRELRLTPLDTIYNLETRFVNMNLQAFDSWP